MKVAAYSSTSSFQVLEGLAEPSLELSVMHVGIEECKPFHTCSDPRHEYILHFVISGKGFYSARGTTAALGAGQMFLIVPEEPIVYGSDRFDPWTYAWIGFKGERAANILKKCGFVGNTLTRKISCTEDIVRCIREILDHQSFAASDLLFRESCMIRLFSLLAKDYEVTTDDIGFNPAISRDSVYAELGTAFIREMYMHPVIGVEEVAAHIGITRARLNRAFQNELNISVQQYMINCRMRHASRLLLTTGLSIKEIAAQSGYSDQLVFSSAFKKKFGVSPKLYREKGGEQADAVPVSL